MAILGSDIPIASFYFRSTVGFPNCCSKAAYPRFGDFASDIPWPGPVQDLNITNDLLDVMYRITEATAKQMSRTHKLFLLVVTLILGCAISIGSMNVYSSDVTDHKDLDVPIMVFVLGFVGCMIGTIVSTCCCFCLGFSSSRALTRIIKDFNQKCECISRALSCVILHPSSLYSIHSWNLYHYS